MASSQGPTAAAEQRQKIGVFNAQGRHAGTVLRALKQKGTFDVLALVPNMSDPKAQQLKDEGFEVAQVDLASRDSIRKCIKGLYGVFFSQNSFKIGHDAELRNAKNVAFIAREADVKLKIIVNLTYPRSDVAGEQELCDRKFEISEYLKTSKTPFCDVELGWYLDHWEQKEMEPRYENGEWVFNASIPPDAEIPWVAVEDLGPVAASIFENAQQWLGKRIQIAGQVATIDQFIDVFKKTVGANARYNYVPPVQRTDLSAREELLMSFYLLFSRNKPFVDFDSLRKLHPGLKDISTWLTESKFMQSQS